MSSKPTKHESDRYYVLRVKKETFWRVLSACGGVSGLFAIAERVLSWVQQ